MKLVEILVFHLFTAFESLIRTPVQIEKLILIISFILSLYVSCNDDDVPPAENEEEIITDVILSFDALGGVTTITARAVDPDGEGPESIQILDDIVLEPNKTYHLKIALENSVAGESITDEVAAEAAEHLIFLAWTDGLFSDPDGNGNIDNRADPINYLDQDSDGLPLGLETLWTTGEIGAGNFRVVLKHQPGIKSSSSTVTQGETDVDLIWDLRVE
ncbi:MAG: hypothetical protein O2887_02955 [Bacteroidetes bacterium]|nr:hypothetical protein [Bacteroidota bacterium]MDA1119448.1 hypothetical protein [Bacteroidota bacterium]